MRIERVPARLREAHEQRRFDKLSRSVRAGGANGATTVGAAFEPAPQMSDDARQQPLTGGGEELVPLLPRLLPGTSDPVTAPTVNTGTMFGQGRLRRIPPVPRTCLAGQMRSEWFEPSSCEQGRQLR